MNPTYLVPVVKPKATSVYGPIFQAGVRLPIPPPFLSDVPLAFIAARYIVA